MLLLSQVVQSGSYLIGNVGNETIRCLNVVSPEASKAEQLLSFGRPDHSEIFITHEEYTYATYHFTCLPYLYAHLLNESTTVYSVLPPPREEYEPQEWMYHLNAGRSTPPHATNAALKNLWTVFRAPGAAREAELRHAQQALEQMQEVPEWYCGHIARLIKGNTRLTPQKSMGLSLDSVAHSSSQDDGAGASDPKRDDDRDNGPEP